MDSKEGKGDRVPPSPSNRPSHSLPGHRRGKIDPDWVPREVVPVLGRGRQLPLLTPDSVDMETMGPSRGPGRPLPVPEVDTETEAGPVDRSCLDKVDTLVRVAPDEAPDITVPRPDTRPFGRSAGGYRRGRNQRDVGYLSFEVEVSSTLYRSPKTDNRFLRQRGDQSSPSRQSLKGSHTEVLVLSSSPWPDPPSTRFP